MVNKRNRTRRYILIGLTFVVVVSSIYFYLDGTTSTPQAQSLIVSAEIGSIENTIAAAGSLKPSNYVDVGAQVSGQLQRLHVEIGDFVEQDQLLAEIDARVQEARVNASRASIEALAVQLNARQAALELARSNVTRQQQLLATDLTSQFEVDTAINAVAAAEASLFQLQKQIEQNEASLETEETQLEFTKIYAPMSGTVVSIEMEEGRTLNAVQLAPTIMRIADLGLMTVEAEISEADIGDIRAGMPVYFTTLGGRQRRWYSEVRQILPTPVVENNVVLYTGLFDIENQDGALLPEMTAQVYFITASAQDVLTVPMGALTLLDRPSRQGRPSAQRNTQGRATESGRPPIARAELAGDEASRPRRNASGAQRSPRGRPALVTIVDDMGVQTEQEIRIGVSSRISAEVREGLKAGDKVVAGIIQSARDQSQQDNGGPRRRFGGPF